ncbi:MAG TPA: fused MFS/spermidine synthase [Candidatus Kapabacteria bacterium]|nr:fused MFS/spermidine synthase [Candidatus Kapabacteria bacterium]
MVVLLLFFASGATALVYEVLWSKYLSMLLGSTVQAQTVVLAVFMGGLAVGNRIFGSRSKTIKNPLLGYGIMELLIGVYAILFPSIYSAADWTFIKVGSNFASATYLLLALKLLISVVLLMIPTILMGGTLPLIAAWIQKQPAFESGARVGIFYATNSLGAMTGAGLAGFYLISTFGMSGSLALTATANIVIGLVAGLLGKREQNEIDYGSAPVAAKTPATTPSPMAAPASSTWFAMLVALTGGVSMGLEVLSARSLALIAGGSLQAFALVLMSFILGIGLGSIIISSSQAARRYGIHMIYGLLLAASAMVVLNVVGIERLTILYSQARFGLAANPVGYYWFQVSIALFAFLILGLPAACLGSAVPLSIRLLQGQTDSLGDQVGRLLTANTIGAVLGVLVTGFILMPLLGLRGAFATLALLLMAAAAYIAFKRADRTAGIIAVAFIGVSFAFIISTGENWRHVMGSGVFRIRDTFLTADYWERRKQQTQIHYYKDSADATVAVEQQRSLPGEPVQQTILRINGKTDASSQGDLATQYLLAHLPMAAKPDAKNVFVLGFGSGITGGALLGHPIERLTIAENCGPVLEAGRFFAEWNRGVLTNSRTVIRRDDARAVLKLSQGKYDVIVCEPSNPWVVGIGSVFSKEFYELCSSRLSDGGVVAQWFHSYEMSDYIVMLVLRTFAASFPNMEIWDTQEGDIVLLGSNKPWNSGPAVYQKIFDHPQVRKDLGQLNITTGVTLWARQIASQKTAFAIPGDGPIQTDDVPILEYAAPQAFFMGVDARRLNYYDERLAQFPIAAKEKVTALRALPEHVLLSSFSPYGSCNTDLRIYTTAVANKASGALARFDPLGHVVFRDPSSYPESPVIPTNATPEFAECLKLEARILRDMQNWREPAARIEQILSSLAERNILAPRDFRPGYFAAFIARCAIGDGDYRAALRYLRLGFIFPQDHDQLLFLSRVLDRIVPREIVSEFEREVEAAKAKAPAPPLISQ